MEPVRNERVKSIFLEAAEVAGAEREAVLAARCGEDAELRKRVDALLQHHDETGSMEILPRETPGAHTPALLAGRLISGRFRILRFVGKGGMGEVYQVNDEELGGQLALKIVLPGLIQEEQMLGRFRREVHLARQVTHPNVCRIFDVGRDRIGGQEFLYLTMEYIAGETLGTYLRKKGKLGVKEALPLLEQVAAGLAALHEKKIVHRDLKPGNVMIVEEDRGALRAVIGDFGLARAILEESLDDGLSRTGLVMGTPGYMAPEQLAGQAVSPATDLFAFGVLAYEMVTGKRAFPARQGNTPPPAPRQIVPELPMDWERAILRCLEVAPEERPGSVEEVVDALAGNTRLRRRGAAAATRRRRWWIGGVAAGLLAAAGLAPLAWQAATKGSGTGAGGASANRAYLEAIDLLDHAYRQGAVEKAIQLLEPVSQTANAPALVHAALGRAYFRQFRTTREVKWLEKSAAACSRAVELDGQLAAARIALARVYTQSGKSDLAMQELQVGMRLDTRSPEGYLALAELYEKQGRSADIEPALQKAVDLAPDYWAGHANLGLHFRNTKRFEEARQEFEQLIRLAPDNASAYGYLGGLYAQQDRFDDARQAFEKELKIAPSFRVYSNLGAVLQLEGKYDEAAEMFQKAIQLNDRDYSSWGNLGSSYLWSVTNKGKAPEAYQRAIALAEEARKASPNDVRILVRLGGFYASIGDAKNSIPLLRQSIALSGDDPGIAYRVGEAYELLQRRDEALRWVGTALRLGYSREFVKRSPELALLRKDPRFAWKK